VSHTSSRVKALGLKVFKRRKSMNTKEESSEGKFHKRITTILSSKHILCFQQDDETTIGSHNSLVLPSS